MGSWKSTGFTRGRERPRGVQLPKHQLLCCAFVKWNRGGHTAVHLPLIVPLHPLLLGIAGWPCWRYTTIIAPNMVCLSVLVTTVPHQGWWWCISSVGTQGYSNWEPNDTCMAVLSFLTPSTPGWLSTLTWGRPRETITQLHCPFTFHALPCKQNSCWNPLAGSIHDFK